MYLTCTVRVLKSEQAKEWRRAPVDSILCDNRVGPLSLLPESFWLHSGKCGLAILPTNPCNLPFPKPTDILPPFLLRISKFIFGALPPTFSHILLSPFLGKFVYKWSRMTVLRSSLYFSGFFITFIHYLMTSCFGWNEMSLFHSFAPSIPHTYIFPYRPQVVLLQF